MANNHRYIRFFAYMGIDDVPRVGGKNASLGEMFCDLSVQVVHVLNGVAITADA
jgi:pyruvate, water dikinase